MFDSDAMSAAPLVSLSIPDDRLSRMLHSLLEPAHIRLHSEI